MPNAFMRQPERESSIQPMHDYGKGSKSISLRDCFSTMDRTSHVEKQNHDGNNHRHNTVIIMLL
jgi:hypothetical protein